MPRAKSLPQKLVKVTSCHSSASTWVFLVKGEREERFVHPIDNCNVNFTVNWVLAFRRNDRWKCISENNLSNTSGGQSEIVKLRHPASDKSAIFVFGAGNLTVQEILIFDEKKRSWFIDDNVKSDGKLYLSTPIDPIFLALPYLRKVIVEFSSFI